MFNPHRFVVHPSCEKDWRITSVKVRPDGAYEVRAIPRPIAPLRFALENDEVAFLSRPSDDPDEQLLQQECVFYVEPGPT